MQKIWPLPKRSFFTAEDAEERLEYLHMYGQKIIEVYKKNTTESTQQQQKQQSSASSSKNKKAIWLVAQLSAG